MCHLVFPTSIYNLKQETDTLNIVILKIGKQMGKSLGGKGKRLVFLLHCSSRVKNLSYVLLP